MNSETRYFRATGKVYLDRDDVIAWLNTYRDKDKELDDDYQPTDVEWLACAMVMSDRGMICWSEINLAPDKRG